MRRRVAAWWVVGLASCSSASLPNSTGIFETIGASSDAGDDDDGTSTTGSTTGADASSDGADDPTVPGDTTAPAESDGSTSAADTTGAVTATSSTSSSGGLEEGSSSSTTEPSALACVDGDLGSELGDDLASGDNGDGDDVGISCANGGGEDVVYTWTAPSDGTYTFDLSGSSFDTALAIVQTDCEGAEVACNDDAIGLASSLTLDVAADETVLVVIDGYRGAVGDYVLDVNPALDLSCVDDDLADTTGEVASGSTVGENDSFAASCASGDGADVGFAWIAPASGTWNFSLSGSAYDTVLAIASPDCGGNEIACNDDGPVDLTSEIDLDVTIGETVIVVIDGYMGDVGDFTLTIQ